MQNSSIAVAMSVYKSDTDYNVKLAIESLLEQTYRNIDIFIEVDGPINSDLEALLRSYCNTDNIFVNFNDKCKGLATRLNSIIDKVMEQGKYDFIARMDADDISLPTRIERQLNFLMVHKEIDVVGSDVIEISEVGEEVFYKKMNPTHDVIRKEIIKRCPFNHPTVMFRSSLFMSQCIRYKAELMNTQDYYLWVDLLAKGKKFANINEPLLYFRVNDDFHSRRGFKKAVNDFKSRLYAFSKLDVLTPSNVIHVVLLFLLRISPSFIKAIAYKVLR